MVQKDNSPSNGKITIADIARASDVSPATVSLVLRDKPGIGDETRLRVKEVAQSLGYLPPATVTRQVSSSELKNIGLLLKVNQYDSPELNHFYAPIVAGIESICRQKQSNLLYANLPVDEHNQPLELPRLLTDEQIDGLLIVGMELTEKLLNHLHQRRLPVVLVDGYADDDDLDAVVTDNVKGGREATRYLIEQGHRNIAILGSEPDAYPSIRGRREGYIEAMVENGLDPLFADCNLLPPEAVKTVTDLLEQNPNTSALFVCNDEVAIAVMKAVQELGKRVPDDLSIIGFDNIALARHVTPSLTTMRVDKMAMGRLAAQHMFNRLEYPKSTYIKTIIQPELIERESVIGI